MGTQHNLYSTGSHWGFAVGKTQILGLASGLAQIPVFLYTNMLVYPTQNCSSGGLSQRQNPTSMVFVAVEYRLYSACESPKSVEWPGNTGYMHEEKKKKETGLG